LVQSVVYFCDSDGFGGAEQALLILLAGLDRDCWHPVLVHHPEPGIGALLEGAQQLDVELCCVPRMEGKSGLGKMPAFVRQLRARRASIFHAHLAWPLACELGLASAVLARVPAIVATEQLFIDLDWSRSHRLQHRLVALGVDRYIPVSHHVAQRLRETFHVPVHKLQVVHNAIAPDRFDRPPNPALRTALTDGTERPIILTVARLEVQKGLAYLLEAATLVPEAVVALVGDGSDRTNLETQARALGIAGRVRFLGYRADVPDLLASCNVFVLPSLYEGLPLAVLEAMAACKPVIATAIGGTDEAVRHGETGLLVPPADPTALAAAIRTVLADPELARRLGSAGRARVHREFCAERMVQQVTRIYDEILGRRG